MAPLQARGAEARPIAFAGLRPALAPDFGETELNRLSEAQRLRKTIHNVLEAVSGETVISHDELRNSLGRAYIVGVFDCAGRVKCLLTTLKPMAARGYSRAVVGDYTTSDEHYLFRIRLLDLNAERVVDESTFELTGRETEDLSRWRKNLEGLFADTGSIRLVSNVAGYTCKLDAKPCTTEKDVITNVPEGEHVVELGKEGYIAKAQEVRVQRKREVRLAMALQERPLQPPAAPDVLQVPAAKAGDQPRWFGQIQLLALMDTKNGGEVFEFFALPDTVVEEKRHFGLIPTPTFFGLRLAGAESDSGLGATLAAGFLTDFRLQLLIAAVDLTHNRLGTKLSVGLLNNAVLSTLSPNTFTVPLGWGNLNSILLGARLSQSFGPVVAELGIGEPLSTGAAARRSNFTIVPEGAPRTPTGSARVAYVHKGIQGKLMANSFPLTVGLSGAIGETRVGASEFSALKTMAPGAVQPEIEDLPLWVISAELLIPIGPFVVSGEAFRGEGLDRYGGAIQQRERVDPATGKHKLLRSQGGWGQVLMNLGEKWSVAAFGGYEEIIRNLGFAVSAFEAYDMRSNVHVGGIVGWTPTTGVYFGAQGSWMRTDFKVPNDAAEVTSGLVACRYNF